ncbi:MAG TPA: hypothetical protein VFG39_08145 [Balneolaceae bacterium]|nr:hypothetical protein [Balneolaceae bacterium]
MKFNKTQGYSFKLFLSIILLFPLTACLSSSDNDSNTGSRVSVFLNLENVNDVITAGDDSLQISVLKFIHGRSAFLSDSDTLYLKQNPKIIIHRYRQDSVKILADGVVREGSFQRLKFAIEQAPPSVDGIDSDFVNGDTLYSIVIKGTYQDSIFVFKSTESFTPVIDLGTPLMAESNRLFQYLIATDVASWFLDEGRQGLINPQGSSAAEAINNNIEGSFRLENVENF